MSDAPPDHAGVAFHPPILLGAFLLLGFVLRAIVPLSFAPERSATLIGPTIVVLSLTMFVWAVATMRRGGGSIPTNKPTDAIVRAGPYGYSRNPIYVSMVALLSGAGIWGNTLWLMGLAALAAYLLWWGVISREEGYLERKFGLDYTAYKSQVRRWL
jgi:protein-S-isoprenylcysteine O-methyltransferase Ste14